jgi:hypothetical protein
MGRILFAALLISASVAFQPASLRPRTRLPGRASAGPLVLAESGSAPTEALAAALRGAALTDARGRPVVLGDRMGPGTSVVVFLRHLG